MKDQSVLDQESNRLVDICLKLDRRQQILLCIAMSYRYGHFLANDLKLKEDELEEIGKDFFQKFFMVGFKLALAYVGTTRKRARKYAKDLDEYPAMLMDIMENLTEYLNPLAMQAVLCLFATTLLISKEKPLGKILLSMMFFCPTAVFTSSIVSFYEDDRNKNDSNMHVICKDPDSFLTSELTLLAETVDVVRRKCPVQTRNAPPVDHEILKVLLKLVTSNLEKKFRDKDRQDKDL